MDCGPFTLAEQYSLPIVLKNLYQGATPPTGCAWPSSKTSSMAWR